MNTIDRNTDTITVGDKVFILCSDNMDYWLKIGRVTLIDSEQQQILVEHGEDGESGGIWWSKWQVLLYSKKTLRNWAQIYIDAHWGLPEHVNKILDRVNPPSEQLENGCR